MSRHIKSLLMHKLIQSLSRFTTLILLSVTLLSMALVATASGPLDPESDPDLPRFGGIDEATYLQLRAEYFARLRGYEPGNLFNPSMRLTALRQLEQQAQQQTQPNGVKSAAVAPWTAIGPNPIPNGQVTGGGTVPVSGRVTAIAVHPTNANIAYVGTAQGGLYRTTNGGTTWTALMDSAQSLAIGAVAIDPSNPSTVFVGTGEGNLSLDSFFGVGLYRINNADTTPVVNGPFETRVAGTGTGASNGHAFLGTAINKIVVDPADGNRLFVGNTTGASGLSGEPICCGGVTPPSAFIGLYFSPNALSATPTFSRVAVSGSFNGLQGVTDIVFEPGSSNNMLVGVRDLGGVGLSGIWRTANAAVASFLPGPTGTAPTFTQVVPTVVTNVKLAINKIGATVNVLAATGENATGQLRKSTDGGATWPTTLTALGAPGAGFCGGQCSYDIAVDMDPANANVIYLGGSADATTSSVLVKATNGTTFSRIDTGLHADFHALAIAPSSTSTVYVGNDGGIWVSANSGGTWTSLNNATFFATQFQSLALHPGDANFTIGGTQDNGTEFRNAASVWTRADFGDGGFALIDQNAADTTNVTMYHTYFNRTSSLIGFARVTSTTCATEGEWVFRGFGDTNPSIGCEGVALGASNGIIGTDAVLFYAPMTLGPGNPNTLYFGTNRLYRSINQGDTMTAVSQVFGAKVSAIGISPSNDNVRIVGLENGSVFATTTGANPLTDVTGASMPALKYVGRAVIDPNNANTAYVAFNGYGVPANQHVWKTTNLAGGAGSWVASGAGIPDVPVNALVVDPANSMQVFAGTDVGVYFSVDGGVTWNPYSAATLPRVAVFDMAIQNPGRILRIATHGKGMYETSLATIVYDKFLYLPIIVN